MKLEELYCYFINPDKNLERLSNIRYLYEQGFKYVHRIAFNDVYSNKIITITKSHLTALKQALVENHFPLLLLEDDAALMQELPMEFSIDGDLIYWGGSNYHSGLTPLMKIEDFNDNYKRVKYMLSSHAILYPTKEIVDVVIKIFEKSILDGEYNDVALAKNSDDKLFLVPNDGLYFYQDDYTRDVTKFYY